MMKWVQILWRGRLYFNSRGKNVGVWFNVECCGVQMEDDDYVIFQMRQVTSTNPYLQQMPPLQICIIPDKLHLIGSLTNP